MIHAKRWALTASMNRSTKFKVVISSGRLFQSGMVICQILYLYVSNFRRNESLCKFSDGLSSWMKTIRKLGSQNCFYTCEVHNIDLADFCMCFAIKDRVVNCVFYNALVGLSVCVTNVIVCIKQTTFEMLTTTCWSTISGFCSLTINYL